MYLNGMGFRGIERVTEIHHTTIIDWVREAEAQLTEDEEAELPKVAELDELQTFVGSKKNKVWLKTALNHYQSGILAITVGDRIGKTFSKLWERVENWGSKWYMTDGYCVYANFIDKSETFSNEKDQNDTGIRRKYTVETLSRSITPRYVVLLQIGRNVEMFSPFTHALPVV